MAQRKNKQAVEAEDDLRPRSARTLTMLTTTRWNGRPVIGKGPGRDGTVLRVPQDVDVRTARRWIDRGIAEVGGEYIPTPKSQRAVEASEAFADVVDEQREARAGKLAELLGQGRERLVDMAKSRLVEVLPSDSDEAIANKLLDVESLEEE